MKRTPSLISAFILIFALFFNQTLWAWSSVGHRLTAAIALHFIEEDTASYLITLLEQHPRFEEDFLSEMPQFVASGDETGKQQWLLGQAAYWPDIARGLPDAERSKYNRPAWHYEQGELIRGSAQQQGNHYIGIAAFDDVQGRPSSSIRTEEAVENLLTAIDYNTWVLANEDLAASQRAVALCWVLHLMGDIHQPMHTGSLYSAHTFERGDLGGNRIPTGEVNLHGRWDQALEEGGVASQLPTLINLISDSDEAKIQGVRSDWTQWMSESREHLQNFVYTDNMLAAAASADAKQAEEIDPAITVSADYIAEMKRISSRRLGLAGLRLAIWFENSLP